MLVSAGPSIARRNSQRVSGGKTRSSLVPPGRFVWLLCDAPATFANLGRQANQAGPDRLAGVASTSSEGAG